MSKVSCFLCGSDGDSRSMQVCPACRNYVCQDCYSDHRVSCEEET